MSDVARKNKAIAAKLRVEIERLRAALEGMLVHGGCSPSTPCGDCQRAREALKGTAEG
jgi:hypothetical protein